MEYENFKAQCSTEIKLMGRKEEQTVNQSKWGFILLKTFCFTQNLRKHRGSMIFRANCWDLNSNTSQTCYFTHSMHYRGCFLLQLVQVGKRVRIIRDKGNPVGPSSYRNLSTLNITEKLFEKLLNPWLTFRERLSTEAIWFWSRAIHNWCDWGSGSSGETS